MRVRAAWQSGRRGNRALGAMPPRQLPRSDLQGDLPQANNADTAFVAGTCEGRMNSCRKPGRFQKRPHGKLRVQQRSHLPRKSSRSSSVVGLSHPSGNVSRSSAASSTGTCRRTSAGTGRATGLTREGNDHRFPTIHRVEQLRQVHFRLVHVRGPVSG